MPFQAAPSVIPNSEIAKLAPSDVIVVTLPMQGGIAAFGGGTVIPDEPTVGYATTG